MAPSAPSLTEQLRQRLADYDGRATTLLGEAEAALGKEPGYCDALIALAGGSDDTVAAGATWLIKNALEAGRTLDPGQTAGLIGHLPHMKAWPAQLHLCQSVRHLTISEGDAIVLADGLIPLLDHARPFVRAWALDALAQVARAHAEFGDRFVGALAKAERDEAASVRARARNLRGVP